jgi:hypothetical protein
MRRRSKIAEILFITVPEDALRLVEIFASKSNFGLRFKADEEKNVHPWASNSEKWLFNNNKRRRRRRAAHNF